jgi:hypothetical protein
VAATPAPAAPAPAAVRPGTGVTDVASRRRPSFEQEVTTNRLSS